MSSSITKFKNYVSLLDEVYKQASCTAVLDGDNSLVSLGANAHEIVIPKFTAMDGLADYSRSAGYVAGDVTLSNETVAMNFDRGRSFVIDAMDDEETAGVAFGKLAAEFIRTKVVPELDAFRFATYASTANISTTSGATLDTAAKVIAALAAAMDGMDEDEVPYEGRYLFITPTLLGLVRDQDNDKSKAILDSFAGIQKVPQTRFYTKIDQYDGTTEGETAGGYVKDTTNGGKDINFMVVHKPSVIQFQKRSIDKIIPPELNQTADAWKFCYREYGVADVYDNKVDGVYLHKKA